LAPLLGASLLLAALLSVSAPSLARAVEPGVVTDLSWGISNADKQRTATAMTDAGVRWTRIGLGWRNLEPSKGSYSSYWLADQDAAVQAASDAGVKVILNVLESPQWASGSTNKYAAPKNPQDLANFMTFIANRYKGKVAAYEIWNEENGSRFWPSGPNAGAYTQMLKASYPAIKAAGRFAVNILCQGQEGASRRFATSTTAPGEEKFAGLEYRPGQLGLPVLPEAMAQLECTVVHAYPGGDHMIFVAQVESGQWTDDAGKEPLLYFRGKYSRLHP